MGGCKGAAVVGSPLTGPGAPIVSAAGGGAIALGCAGVYGGVGGMFNGEKCKEVWALTTTCTYCCVCKEVPLPPLPDLPTTGGDEEDSTGGANCEIEVNCEEAEIKDYDSNSEVKVSED